MGKPTREETKRAVSIGNTDDVDDLIHSAINLDQRIVLEVELLRQSLGAISRDSEQRFDDIIKDLVRDAEILREARSHLGHNMKRLDAFSDEALR